MPSNMESRKPSIHFPTAKRVVFFRVKIRTTPTATSSKSSNSNSSSNKVRTWPVPNMIPGFVQLYVAIGWEICVWKVAPVNFYINTIFLRCRCVDTENDAKYLNVHSVISARQIGWNACFTARVFVSMVHFVVINTLDEIDKIYLKWLTLPLDWVKCKQRRINSRENQVSDRTTAGTTNKGTRRVVPMGMLPVDVLHRNQMNSSKSVCANTLCRAIAHSGTDVIMLTVNTNCDNFQTKKTKINTETKGRSLLSFIHIVRVCVYLCAWLWLVSMFKTVSTKQCCW